MDISKYRELVRDPVALVTGSGSGLGFEIARELAEGGCLVWITDKDAGLVEGAVARLEKAGLKVRGLRLDVTQPESVAAAVRDVEAAGKLDILVNNAGIEIESQRGDDGEPHPLPPSELELATLRQTHDVNVVGPFLMTKAFLPLIRRSEAGRIVNQSSSLGSLGGRTAPGSGLAFFNLLAYCSSKSALNAMTISFAEELRSTGIKVNSSCPGYCRTGINRFHGPRTAEQGAVAALRLATLPADGPTGSFFNDEGVVAW